MSTALRLKTALVAAAAALALTACGRNTDSKTAGEKLDSVVATVEKKAEEAKVEVQQGAAEVKADGQAVAAEAAASVAQAADQIGAKIEDASITASVNAELAKDPDLSALKINVDTRKGHVVLKGKAPTAEARERATRLAAAVKGVVAVDNRLRVRS